MMAQRALLSLAVALGSLCVAADVLCGTWNLKWFPSGRAEHRASPRVEAANVADAADIIRAGIAAAKGAGVILFLQELRDDKACEQLIAAVKRPKLASVSVTAFRDRDNRLMWQQCAIASTLPPVDVGWAYWKRTRHVFPPRGYAYAILDGGADGLIACYCVHLKSNYAATRPEVWAQNVQKREWPARQLVEFARRIKSPDGRAVTRIVIAGDFNTDPTSPRHAAEKTVSILTDAGFANCFAGLPLDRRGTHPGNTKYPDITFDYIFHRGFSSAAEPVLASEVPLSDHRMVWLRLDGRPAEKR